MTEVKKPADLPQPEDPSLTDEELQLTVPDGELFDKNVSDEDTFDQDDDAETLDKIAAEEPPKDGDE